MQRWTHKSYFVLFFFVRLLLLLLLLLLRLVALVLSVNLTRCVLLRLLRLVIVVLDAEDSESRRHGGRHLTVFRQRAKTHVEVDVTPNRALPASNQRRCGKSTGNTRETSLNVGVDVATSRDL